MYALVGLDQRGFGRAERRRKKRRKVLGEAEPLRIGDDLPRAEHLHHPHRGHVARILERATQRDRPFVLAVVIARRVRRLARAGVERGGRVVENRRRRQPAIDGGRVEKRLERGAELPVGLRGAIELAAREAEAADHCEDLPGPVVDGDERALELRLLLESDGRLARGIERRDADLDEIAGLDQFGWVRPSRPLIAGARQVRSVAAEAHARGRGSLLTRIDGHDDRRDDVAGGHRPRPAIVTEVSIVCPSSRMFRAGLRQMPRRLRHLAQTRVDGLVGRALQLGVERGANRQAVLVERLGAVLGFDVLADLLDEVRRDRSTPGQARRE